MVSVDSYTLRWNVTIQPSDSASPSDSVNRSFGLKKSESPTATDTRALRLVKPAFAESFSAAETRILNFGKRPSEDPLLAEVREFASTKPVSDSIAIAEARVLRLVRPNLAESIPIADTGALGFGKTVSDSASAADSVVRSFGLSKTDNLDVLDDAVRSFGLKKNEGVGVAETRIFSFGLNDLADAIGIAEARANLFGLRLSDTFPEITEVHDCSTFDGPKRFDVDCFFDHCIIVDLKTGKNTSEEASFDEALVLALLDFIEIGLSEGISVEELRASDLQFETFTESVTAADTLSNMPGLGLSDSAGIIDTLGAFNIILGRSESSPLSDSTSFTFVKPITELFSAADSAAFGFFRGANESILIVDDAPVFGVGLNLAEVAPFLDEFSFDLLLGARAFIDFIHQYQLSTIDIAAFADAITSVAGFAVATTEIKVLGEPE